MKVVFVCTGNTCRSPMAEYLMKKIIKQDSHDIEVESAGIMASPGQPAHPHTVKILLANGILDIENHRSQSLDQVDLSEGDILLGMTEIHKQHLLDDYGTGQVVVDKLDSFVGLPLDLSDPYGRESGRYKKLYDELTKALVKLRDILAE